MPIPTALIAAWARSAVVPRGGAFKALQAHDIATPVLLALLQRAGVPAASVDAVVLGNALGAGGNPARLLALQAGLPERCAAMTVDTQCCAGLDAVAMGAALIDAGQAQVVIAGGVEAWSRSPIRMHRPLNNHDVPVAYERPAFAPSPEQDPDLLLSAARFAAQQGYSRAQQEAYAIDSHARALAHQTTLAQEMVTVAGVSHDVYPRVIDPVRAARMPTVARSDRPVKASDSDDCVLSALTISAQADGAALVLLLSAAAVTRLGVQPRAAWVSSASLGGSPETPLLMAETATRETLLRAEVSTTPALLHAVELHDAFAVQGLRYATFLDSLGVPPERLNACGGGLARGHPIGASGAIALVRVLADVAQDAPVGAQGLVAVAGAGGLGAAALVAKL